LGPDCQHVPGEYRGADRRAHLRTLVRRHPAHSVFDHRPVIIVICAIGAYTVHNSMFDVYLMVVFGVVGYAFKKLGYPLAPMVLALVLGDRAEENFRNAIKGSQGDLAVFFSNSLVGGLTGLALFLLFWPLIRTLWRALLGRRAA